MLLGVVATGAALFVISLKYWFHKFLSLLSVRGPKSFRDTGAKNPRVRRFDHWGAANRGLQLGENLTSLYAARPPLRAARIGALMNFISPDVQAFVSLSRLAQQFQL